jgi:diguanylate cyclase (GGDEF)-like protein
MKRDASWLCPTPGDRERFLDMQTRLLRARVSTIAAAMVVMLSVAGRGSWPLFVAGGAMVAIVLAGGMQLEHRRRPELWVFATTMLNVQIAIAIGTVLTGGPVTPMSCLHAIPVLMLGARFSNRGLLVGVPVAVVLVIGTTLGVDLQYVLDNPESLVIPLTLVLSTAFYTSPLVASDLRHREDSTLDELTGLLNRRAFAPRFAELAQQAALNGQPVSVVAVDIDHFKRVNDEHGHAAGDEVLREVARVFRQRLRTFEMLYRMGGDEFLLVLPGADTATASDIADALRRAVETLRPADLDVTCSCGVATAEGADVGFEMLERADAALYAAKRRGRDRVDLAA